jgi:hypothetical protein
VEYKDLAGRMEHKVNGWRQTEWQTNPVSGARYRWLVRDNDDPAPSSPAAPAWDDGPASAAVLTRAKMAGLAALQSGYGRGPASCGTCPSCTYGRPQDCRRPLGKAMARLRAAQAAADRVDQAEATAVELQRIIFAEEQRRRLAF